MKNVLNIIKLSKYLTNYNSPIFIVNVSLRMKSFKNKYPEAKGSFIASSATVLGQVKIGINSSVWYGAILRGYYNKY